MKNTKVGMMALTFCLASAPAFAQATQSKSTVDVEGAKIEVHEAKVASKPCPRTSFVREAENAEALPAVVGGLLTTFVDKGFGVLVDWLKKRKEKLNGTVSAKHVGEFYLNDRIKADCYIFKAGIFGKNGELTGEKIYAEFLPVTFDQGKMFTLKPMYVKYTSTIAERKGGKDGKETSLAISLKYNLPLKAKTDKKGTAPVAAGTLKDGGGFSYAFGKLKPGSVLDHKSLEIFNGGLVYSPPAVEDEQGNLLPIAYQMTATWIDSDKPSPLANAFVESVDENKSKISSEVSDFMKNLLGLAEKK